MNHNTPNYLSHEFLSRTKGGERPLLGSLHRSRYELLSQVRTVFRQNERFHDVLRRLQEGLQPESDLFLDIMSWQSRELALCMGIWSRRLTNVISIPFAVLQRVRRSKSIALSILQQADE